MNQVNVNLHTRGNGNMRQTGVLLLFLVAGVGCGGGDDGAESCSAPLVEGNTSLSGSPASTTTATATVYGSGRLPADARDGLQIWLNVVQGTMPYHVFTATTPILACGSGFSFRVHELPAGTYSLGYELYDASNGSIHPVLSGTSSNDFTLTDGATVEFAPTF